MKKEELSKIVEEIQVARSEIEATNLNEFIDELVDQIQVLDEEAGKITRELICVVAADFYNEAKEGKNVCELARNYIASLRDKDGVTSVLRNE